MPSVEIAVDLAPGVEAPPGPVTLRGQVEEVTASDAPAHVVARAVLRDVVLTRGATLTVDVPSPDPRSRYTVRVHADCDGSGDVAPEDLVSTQASPVLTQGHPDAVEVRLFPASPR